MSVKYTERAIAAVLDSDKYVVAAAQRGTGVQVNLDLTKFGNDHTGQVAALWAAIDKLAEAGYNVDRSAFRMSARGAKGYRPWPHFYVNPPDTTATAQANAAGAAAEAQLKMLRAAIEAGASADVLQKMSEAAGSTEETSDDSTDDGDDSGEDDEKIPV